MRGLAFLHKGVRHQHDSWDVHVGDVMLLIASIALRSVGKVKEDAEKRFWHIAHMFEVCET